MLEKSNLKAPKPSDLIKLRKCIETGDIETVQELISNNPRFLISCGDTPSILHVRVFNSVCEIYINKNRFNKLCAM